MIVRLGDAQTIPWLILKEGIADGVIIVALLFTTPWALELGLATVVLAKTFVGQKTNIIAQR